MNHWCYYLDTTTTRNVAEGQSACQSYNSSAKLVDIETPEEMKAINDYLLLGTSIRDGPIIEIKNRIELNFFIFYIIENRT